jgi:hypothetical protein
MAKSFKISIQENLFSAPTNDMHLSSLNQKYGIMHKQQNTAHGMHFS